MRTVSRGDRGKLLVSTHYMLNAVKFCNIIVKGTIKLSFLVLLPMATSSLRALPLYYSRNLNYIYTLVVEIFFLTPFAVRILEASSYQAGEKSY